MKRLLRILIPLGIIGLPGVVFGNGEITVISNIIPQNGAFTGLIDSSQTTNQTQYFSKNLSGADSNVQHALQTLDQLTVSGVVNVASVTTGHGLYETVTASTVTISLSTPIANSDIDGSSITKAGVLVGGSNISVSPGAGVSTISFTGTIPVIVVGSVTTNASMIESVAGTTVTLGVNPSSGTLQGNTFNGANQLLQLSASALVPNSNIDASSVTKGGVLVGGTNISIGAGVGVTTITFTGSIGVIQVASITTNASLNETVTAGTVTLSVNPSSGTLQGNTFNGNNQLVQTGSSGLIGNTNIDGSSVSKMGILTSANSNLTIAQGVGFTTFTVNVPSVVVSSIVAGTGINVSIVGGTDTISLANTTVTPASYTNMNATVDQQGRITTASNGSAGGGSGITGITGSTGTQSGFTSIFSTSITNVNLNQTQFSGVLTNSTWYVTINSNLPGGSSSYAQISPASPPQTGPISLTTGTILIFNASTVTITNTLVTTNTVSLTVSVSSNQVADQTEWKNNSVVVASVSASGTFTDKYGVVAGSLTITNGGTNVVKANNGLLYTAQVSLSTDVTGVLAGSSVGGGSTSYAQINPTSQQSGAINVASGTIATLYTTTITLQGVGNSAVTATILYSTGTSEVKISSNVNANGYFESSAGVIAMSTLTSGIIINAGSTNTALGNFQVNTGSILSAFVVNAATDSITINATTTVNAAMVSNGTAGIPKQVWTSSGAGVADYWSNHGIVTVSSFSQISASSATTQTTYGKTNLSAQITPTSTSDRVLVTVSGMMAASGAVSAECDLNVSNTGVTNLATNPTQVATDMVVGVAGVGNAGFSWVDSPASASAVTYTVLFKAAGTTPTCTFCSGSGTGTCSIFVQDIGPQ